MKVYKQNNKLAVYLPPDVSKSLGLDENDEVMFFRYNDKAFLLTKKSDIADLVIGAPEKKSEGKAAATATSAPQPAAHLMVHMIGVPSLSGEEIAVLKKLDTLRFSQRTVDNIGKLLDQKEKETLQGMLSKRVVALFKKDGQTLYSIPPSVYDNFLMRKKVASPQLASEPAQRPMRARFGNTAPLYNATNAPEITELETNGYLVLQTESDAARVSLLLETSIRHGQVIGTRTFSKKFFIVTRHFLDQHTSSIFKMLGGGAKKVPDIAKEEGITEDAARALLWILAENGDITERRRDLFAIA